MDRRAAHLLAALALVVALLGVSTALVAEVREEILKAQRTQQQDLELAPPTEDQRGLPIDEFTLLDPAWAQFGDVDRAGNVLHLLSNGTLLFDAGDRIQVAPIELTGPSRLELPRGATYRGSQITCTEGCVLYGDQGRLAVPANASLVLPRSTRLPVPQGQVTSGQSFELPAGSRLFLAPITMRQATALPMGPGTTIILPPGATTVPADPTDSRAELPVDTIVRGAQEDAPSVQELVRRNPPAAPPPLVPPPEDQPTQPIIEVTHVPEAIRKGNPFTVRGFVRMPDGSPSVDHPVTLYANATKETPGFVIQIGTIATNGTGHFEALARINASRPAQPYHIVAQAHARGDLDPPMVEAWSDPVVDVQAETQLELTVPREEGKQVPVSFRARVTDEHGAPVPGQRVVFRLEGIDREPISALTDQEGRALAIEPHGFPFPGTWNVSARFAGTEHLSPSQDWGHVVIKDARIQTNPTIVVPRGETATLNGEVFLEGRGADGIEVLARYADLRAAALTDANGTFQLHFGVPSDLRVGNYTMELETQGITARRSVVVTVTGQSLLESQAPAHLPLGGTLPLAVRAVDELGTPLPGLQVRAATPSGGQSQALTDEDGRATVPVSLASAGTWTLRLSTPGTPLHVGTVENVPLTVGQVNLHGDPQLSPGETRNVTLLFTINGAPMPGEPVVVRGPGIRAQGQTNEEGRAFLQLATPRDQEPGPVGLHVELARYGLVLDQVARVLDRPRLDVDVLQPGTDGDSVVLRVVVIGDTGFLDGVPLTARAQGAFTGTAQAVTGADGKAELTLERPRSADGQVLISVRAEETGTTAAAVHAATANVTPAPFPWWLAVPAVFLLGAGAWALWRRRRPMDPQAPAPPKGPVLELAITPQADHGLPPVWHEGEQTWLHVCLTTRHGAPIADVPVHISGPHGRATIVLDDQGRARLPVPATEAVDAGVMSFHAGFGGEGLHAPTEATLDVRLVDYRQEIDREYQDLRERAAASGRCGTDATPRELARAFGSTDQARQLAGLFERTDYSPHPVHRSDYVAFMQAKDALVDDGHDGAAS